MTSLSMNPQCALILRNGESLGTGRGLFYGNLPNVQNTPDVAQARRDQEIPQLNRTMWQMQNEIIRMRRGDDSNTRNPSSVQGVGASNLGFRNKTEGNQCNENYQAPNRFP